MAELPEDVVDGILAHMNADHAEAGLAIVRVNFAANAVSAEMIGVETGRGLWRAVYSDDSSRIVEVPWGAPVETAEDVRRIVVAMAEAAEERIAAYNPDTLAARYLPAPPEGGWEAAMHRFHEEMQAKGGSFFGGSGEQGHAR